MKLFIVFFILFASSNLAAEISRDNLKSIRTMFYSSVEDEKYLSKLEDYLAQNFPANAVRPAIIRAYFAAIEAVKGKHAFWPFKKLSYLNKSMDSLEAVIKTEPSNLEVRFLRFSILHHLPGILGYSAETQGDAFAILTLLKRRDYSGLDQSIVTGIAEFLYRSGRISEENKKELVFLFPGMKTDE